MKHLLVFITLSLGTFDLYSQAQQVTFDGPDGKEMTLRQYYVAFLMSGEIRSQNKEESEQIQSEHIAYLTKLWEDGIIILNGPFDEDTSLRGMSIYATDNAEQAKEFAENDPAVKSGRLKIEIHPWWSAPFMPEFTK
ncbi:MAG: YciI family protein [Bacteroidia bacterium]